MTAARARGASRGASRVKLLDAVQSLSLAKGFPAMTVDEVCAEANVSKGSFYHHFASKEAIGHAALDSYFGELVAALTASDNVQRDKQAEDPVERLRAFIAHAAVVCSGPLLTNGCMLGSFALDLAESHPDIRQKLSGQFSELAGFVEGLLADAAEAADTELPAARLAQQFLAIIEGSIVLAKAHADPQILNSGVALFADHVDLLLANGRHA